MIVHMLQMSYFKARIPDFEARICNYGHAPHISDCENFQQHVLRFIEN